MKFSIGYNHDIGLLDILDKYKCNIASVYFPLPRKYCGSGRHIVQINSYENEIPLLIKKCRKLNILPQLLLNSTCAGEAGLEKETFSKIISYLQKLKKLGLESVIAANPIYIPEIKEQVKGIRIESSVNCYVKTTESAIYLKDLGVDTLTIDRDINRNIPLIKEIKNKSGLKIKIMLNEGCLRNCPFRQAHFNFIAHAGTPKTEMISEDFFEKWCLRILSKNPAKIFSVPFIPPEGIMYYQGIADYFKISCRDSATSLIELRLKAYINKSFDGNLLSLLDCAGLTPYFSYIDSKILNENGFFKKIISCQDNCKKCGYCGKLTEKAVVTNSYFLKPSHRIRANENKKAVRIYERALKGLANGTPDKTAISRFLFNHYKNSGQTEKISEEILGQLLKLKNRQP